MSRDESCAQTAKSQTQKRHSGFVIPDRSLLLYLQHGQHRVQLVLSERDVGGDFSQHVDGLQPHFLDLIVEHVDQEVETFLGEARRRPSEVAQRLHRCDTNL